MCWEMMNSTNGYLDKSPKNDKNVRDIETDLDTFAMRPGK